MKYFTREIGRDRGLRQIVLFFTPRMDGITLMLEAFGPDTGSLTDMTLACNILKKHNTSSPKVPHLTINQLTRYVTCDNQEKLSLWCRMPIPIPAGREGAKSMLQGWAK